MKLRWSDGESERQRVHDEEEGQVALRVGGVDVERVALAAGAERDRGHANEQHDEGPEHEHERAHDEREVDGAHQSSGEVDTPSSVVATARSRPAALRASTVRASGMRTRTAASARTTIESQLEKK